MTTYRYFLEPSVWWCRATENPKKLPLVFPCLTTGNRSSMLNPLQVCVPWYTAKTAQSNSLGDMFGLFVPRECSGLPADTRSARVRRGSLPQWAPTGRLRFTETSPSRAACPPSRSELLPRCRCLLPSASLCRPPLLSLPSSLPSTPIWNKCTYSVQQHSHTAECG